jgi:hypothetical protein
VTRSGTTWSPSPKLIEEWNAHFGSRLDIHAEIVRAAEWIHENRKRRKARDQMSTFMRRWMNRSAEIRRTIDTEREDLDRSGVIMPEPLPGNRPCSRSNCQGRSSNGTGFCDACLEHIRREDAERRRDRALAAAAERAERRRW